MSAGLVQQASGQLVVPPELGGMGNRLWQLLRTETAVVLPDPATRVKGRGLQIWWPDMTPEQLQHLVECVRQLYADSAEWPNDEYKHSARSQIKGFLARYEGPDNGQ